MTPKKKSQSSSVSVAILMGSASDHDVMKDAAAALAEVGIESEMRVLSAHRTPDEAADFARGAEARGVRVIIAGAGGAAHLAGAMAAQSTLPVIGVPIGNPPLGGLDALLATVQMPRGVPVATVAIGGAWNAGLLAAQIVATADPNAREALKKYRAKLREQVLARKLPS